MHPALVQIALLGLSLPSAAAQTPVHLPAEPATEALMRGLELELDGEAEWVKTASAAEVRIQLQEEGRRLIVEDAEAHLLVDRRVRSTGPATTRIFVALVAQAVRHHRRPRVGAPPLPPVRTSSTGTVSPSRPAPPWAEAATRIAPPITVPDPRPAIRVADTATTSPEAFGLALHLEPQLRSWLTPAAPRAGLGIGVQATWGAWGLGLQLSGEAGAALVTEQVQAQLYGLGLGLELTRRLYAFGPAELRGVLGAGLALLLGSSQAAQPPFADPGLPSNLSLLDPFIAPGLAVGWPLSSRLDLSVLAGARIALVSHLIRLPSGFGVQTVAPIRSGPVRPWLGLRLGWRLF